MDKGAGQSDEMTDLELVDCCTLLVGHGGMSLPLGEGIGVKMEFKQLLISLLVLKTTESNLLDIISWVCVIM